MRIAAAFRATLFVKSSIEGRRAETGRRTRRGRFAKWLVEPSELEALVDDATKKSAAAISRRTIVDRRASSVDRGCKARFTPPVRARRSPSLWKVDDEATRELFETSTRAFGETRKQEFALWQRSPRCGKNVDPRAMGPRGSDRRSELNAIGRVGFRSVHRGMRLIDA